MRTSIIVSVALLWAVSCASEREPKTDERAPLRMVVLPDLSRVEESVQTQLR